MTGRCGWAIRRWRVFFFDDDAHAARLLDFQRGVCAFVGLFFERPDVAIALAVARLDEARRRAALAERLADRPDSFSQRVVVDLLAIPELFEQFLAADDAVAVVDEIEQNLKRLVRQVHLIAIADDQPPVGVEQTISEKILLAKMMVRRKRHRYSPESY